MRKCLKKLKLKKHYTSLFLFLLLVARTGVEDTRLEAKDTKKNFRQGKGQTLLRLRTGMLRPRTQAQVFSKKKSLQENFSSDLKKKKKKKRMVFKKFFRRSPKKKTKEVFAKFSARFLAFSNKILTIQKIVLSSSRGQSSFRGLEAWRPRPRTSKCVLEAKDVLEDSTSVGGISIGRAVLPPLSPLWLCP